MTLWSSWATQEHLRIFRSSDDACLREGILGKSWRKLVHGSGSGLRHNIIFSSSGAVRSMEVFDMLSFDGSRSCCSGKLLHSELGWKSSCLDSKQVREVSEVLLTFSHAALRRK